jgi:hypothetical protein
VDIARWIVPTAVGVVLVTVAVVELVRLAQLPRPGEVRLLDEAEVLFEPRDLVIDLRAGGGSAGDVLVEPIHELTEGWGEIMEDGPWTTGDRSVITLRLPRAGHRVLFIEARLDPPRGPPVLLRVTANGAECGLVQLRRMLHAERLVLPPGLLEVGANSLEFELVRRGRPSEPAPGRSFQLRRLLLVEQAEAEFRQIVTRRPVEIDSEQGLVVVRAPGRLVLRFDLPYAGSFLSFQYRSRARSMGAGPVVGVGRWFPNLAAVDTMATFTLAANHARFRNPYFYMGHHVGRSVLWFDVEPDTAEAALVIRNLRLTPGPPS